MAELFENAQKLNVRICNKYDTYEAWQGSSIVLGEGELAVCVIPSEATETGLTPPAVGFKFGNGVDVFKDLAWAQATAGDVHAWAKKATPDFADLDEAYKSQLAGYITNVADSDTNTTYSFAFEGDKLIIKSLELGAEEEQPVAEFDLGISGKIAKVAGATAGHVAIMTSDGQIADGAIALGDLATDAELAEAIAPLATKQELADEKAALNEAIQGVADDVAANLEEIGKLKTADQNLQVAINGKVAKVNGVVGNVVAFAADGEIADTGIVATNVVELSELEAAIAPLAVAKDVEDSFAEVDEAIQGVADDVAEALEAIEVLNGAATVEGSVKKQVADAIAGVVASAPQDFDTLKEIADYIASDKTGAAELSNRVAAVETTLNAEDTGLIDQVAVLNEKAHEHTNKGVIDGITADQVTAWDAAVQSISGVEATKTGTNVEVTAVSTNLLKQGSKTIVFRCGSASTVI